jgi:hypothetical protein
MDGDGKMSVFFGLLVYVESSGIFGSILNLSTDRYFLEKKDVVS